MLQDFGKSFVSQWGDDQSKWQTMFLWTARQGGLSSVSTEGHFCHNYCCTKFWNPGISLLSLVWCSKTTLSEGSVWVKELHYWQKMVLSMQGSSSTLADTHSGPTAFVWKYILWYFLKINVQVRSPVRSILKQRFKVNSQTKEQCFLGSKVAFSSPKSRWKSLNDVMI